MEEGSTPTFYIRLDLRTAAINNETSQGAGAGAAIEGAVAVMNACILRRISKDELGGDQNTDVAIDAFLGGLLSLTRREGLATGGSGFSESAVRGNHFRTIPR